MRTLRPRASDASVSQDQPQLASALNIDPNQTQVDESHPKGDGANGVNEDTLQGHRQILDCVLIIPRAQLYRATGPVPSSSKESVGSELITRTAGKSTRLTRTSSPLAVDSSASTSSAPPNPRKRQKLEVAASISTLTADPPAPPKRGRGRPRKIKTGLLTPESSVTSVQPSRSLRQRPTNNVAKAAVPAVTSIAAPTEDGIGLATGVEPDSHDQDEAMQVESVLEEVDPQPPPPPPPLPDESTERDEPLPADHAQRETLSPEAASDIMSLSQPDYAVEDIDFETLSLIEDASLPWEADRTLSEHNDATNETSAPLYLPPVVSYIVGSMKTALAAERSARLHAEEGYEREVRKRVAAEERLTREVTRRRAAERAIVELEERTGSELEPGPSADASTEKRNAGVQHYYVSAQYGRGQR